MEAAAANIIWSRSVSKHKLRYTDMVCDGDSKAYNTVWDIYGICDDCIEFESMDKKKFSLQRVAENRTVQNMGEKTFHGRS